MPTLIFLHGLEGSNKGYKAVMLGKLFPDIILPYFRGEFEERMQQLRGIIDDKDELTIIGSSYGGLMAAAYALERPSAIVKLILLAPALHFYPWPDAVTPIAAPVVIYHGTGDDVVDLAKTRDCAEKLFSNLEFIEVDDDHRLKKTVNEIDWQAVVEAS